MAFALLLDEAYQISVESETSLKSAALVQLNNIEPFLSVLTESRVGASGAFKLIWSDVSSRIASACCLEIS